MIWDEPEPGQADGFAEAGPGSIPYPTPRQVPDRSRTRSRRPPQGRSRPNPQLPTFITGFAASQDGATLATLGIAGFSLLLMAVTVLSRNGSLAPWFVTHIDASGRPDQWGTSATIWRIPLMVAMLTIASVLCAVFLAKRDAFAARFLVSSVILVHVLAWIALIRLAW